MRDLFIDLRMQKGVADGIGVGMKLFRSFDLITVSVIALTKGEGGEMKLDLKFD